MPDITQALPAAEPSHEDIARRAYELYCDSHFEDGHDLEHWLMAEEELRAGRQPRAIEKPDRRATRFRSAGADRSHAASQAAASPSSSF